MYSIKALAVLLLVGAAAAQYNYKAPEPPKNTYLPPTTQKPYQSDAQVAAEGLGPDGEWEGGMPFDFTYAVKEDDGNDFSHQAKSDGDVVTGEYRILLPDGRTQVVKYTADWKNGYNAEVTYEGEAVYPEPKPTSRPPPPPPRPTTRPPPPPPRPTNPPPRPVTRPPPPPPRPTTRNPYENQEDNDSQGLRPSSTPGYNYRPPPPPPTTRPTPPPYRPPPPPQTTRRPPPPPPTQGYNYQPPTTRRPPPPPPTTRPPPPPTPPGLYGTPNQPFGVRNNPKFGYSK